MCPDDFFFLPALKTVFFRDNATFRNHEKFLAELIMHRSTGKKKKSCKKLCSENVLFKVEKIKEVLKSRLLNKRIYQILKVEKTILQFL